MTGIEVSDGVPVILSEAKDLLRSRGREQILRAFGSSIHRVMYLGRFVFRRNHPMNRSPDEAIGASAETSLKELTPLEDTTRLCRERSLRLDWISGAA